MNGLEAPDEQQINTVTQRATQQNSEKSKPTCYHCKEPRHYRNQCRQIKQEKDRAQHITNRAGKQKKIVVRQTQTPTKSFITFLMQTIQIFKKTENRDLSTHLVRPVVKLTIPQRNVMLLGSKRS